MGASQGAQAKMCIEPGAAPHTFDTSSEFLEFLNENLKATGTIVDNAGISGTRSHHTERAVEGEYTVAGTITANLTPLDLVTWWPRILGANASGTTFALAETLQAFGVQVDRVAKVFSYSDCYVNKCTIKGERNQLVSWALDIIGTTETVGDAGTFPAITLGVASNCIPYHFKDGTCSLSSGSRSILSFEIVIDNQLESQFAMGATTASAITPKDRIVTLTATTPYTSGETALYGAAGASGTLTLTKAAMSTLFTFADLRAPINSPVVTGRTETTMTLNYQARMSSTTRELVVTHDSTA